MRVLVKDSATFTTSLPLRRRLQDLFRQYDVEIDLSDTRFVDHAVMSRLHVMQADLVSQNLTLTISGLDHHRPFSENVGAARKNRLVPTSQA